MDRAHSKRWRDRAGVKGHPDRVGCAVARCRAVEYSAEKGFAFAAGSWEAFSTRGHL
jgi:hypothetical protein